MFKRTNKKKVEYDVVVSIDKKSTEILHLALIASSNSTLEEMIKCKNAEEMSKLSSKYQTEKELYSQAYISEGDYSCSNYGAYIIIKSLEAYKENISKELKKADEAKFDTLCEERYIANSLYNLFEGQKVVKKIDREGDE